MFQTQLVICGFKKLVLTDGNAVKFEIKMWVNVLLFVVGLITAAYFYMTRKFGTFKAHGIPEYEPSFPFGSPMTKEMFTGQLNFARMLEKMYHE